MATRDLTKQFVNIRTKARNDPSMRRRTPEDYEQDVDIEAVKTRLPPAWATKIDKAQGSMVNIKKGMTELGVLHTKRLMGNSDFDSDEAKQEREIDAKTQEITQHFRQAEGILKQFARQGDETKLSDAEVRVRKNVQSGIAKRLQTLSGRFRAVQKDYLARVQKQKSGTDGGAAYDMLSKDPRLAESVDHGFNQSQINMVNNMEELVNQRDDEITKIAKSVEELATIFKELAVLIIDQVSPAFSPRSPDLLGLTLSFVLSPHTRKLSRLSSHRPPPLPTTTTTPAPRAQFWIASITTWMQQ